MEYVNVAVEVYIVGRIVEFVFIAQTIKQVYLDNDGFVVSKFFT